MILVKAPNKMPPDYWKPTIFLSGPGDAQNENSNWWREEIEAKLSDLNVIIFDPCREDWDELQQDKEAMQRQIEWEIKSIDNASYVLFYFPPNTTGGGISMFELGFVIGQDSGQTQYVCCQDGFWAKENVIAACEFMGAEMVGSLDELVMAIRNDWRIKKVRS